MKLLCTRSVIMSDNTVAFHEGKVYDFVMSVTQIARTQVDEQGRVNVHVFYTDGPQKWSDYFEIVGE